MSVAAKKPCQYPACPALVSGAAYCDKHKAKMKQVNSTATDFHATDPVKASRKFLDSAGWRRLREEKMYANPFCEECERMGQVTLAKEVDHRKPRNTHPELAMEISNLQSLCSPCHGAKTRSENNSGESGKCFVVTGLPGVGKTRWVEDRRLAGDAVWDFDQIADTIFKCPSFPHPKPCVDALLAMRSAFLNWVVQPGRLCRVFFIASDASTGAQIAAKIKAEHVHLSIPEEERQERLANRMEGGAL